MNACPAPNEIDPAACLRALLDASPVAVIALDDQSRVRLWSPAAESLLGWSAAELIGQPLPLDPLNEPPGSQSWRDRVLRGEVIRTTSSRNARRKGGGGVSFLWSATPLRDPPGRVTGILCLCFDLAGKLELESNLEHAERLENIGRVAGGIAHDLNGVFASILLLAPLLKSDVATPGGRALLDMVEANSQRGTAIVNQVLAMARGAKLEKSPLQTRHLLREATQMIQASFPPGIRLVMNLPRDLWMVEGNANQLHQIILNLCLNARDAMPDGGVLTLTARNLPAAEAAALSEAGGREMPWIVWTIMDTGVGIPAADLSRIFGPYFTTKPEGCGHGLGLYNTRAIVSHHGGFIRVDSQPGRGSRFEVFLPACPGQATVFEAVPESATPAGKGECILVVDDEETIRVPVRTALERRGYTVLVAGDGVEALTLFKWRQSEVKLVLTDLVMPRLGGVALLEAVQHLAPGVRKIVMSGAADQNMRTDLSKLSIDGFLEKPFGPSKLLATVRQALDGLDRTPAV